MLSKTLHNDSGVRTMNREMLDQRFHDLKSFICFFIGPTFYGQIFVVAQSIEELEKVTEHSDRVQDSGDTLTEPTSKCVNRETSCARVRLWVYSGSTSYSDSVDKCFGEPLIRVLPGACQYHKVPCGAYDSWFH